MRLHLPLALLLALPLPLAAQTEAPAPDAPVAQACRANLDGTDTILQPGGDTADATGGVGALDATVIDALPACDPLVILQHLTPELAEGERAAFCLVRAEDDPASVIGFSEGSRADDLTCADPSGFCEYVNTTKDAALDVAGLGKDATVTEQAGAASKGVQALRDGAGATILTGTGGAVASTLSSLGASALAAVTAPVAIAAGVVSVVAVGGAVYVCQ